MAAKLRIAFNCHDEAADALTYENAERRFSLNVSHERLSSEAERDTVMMTGNGLLDFLAASAPGRLAVLPEAECLQVEAGATLQRSGEPIEFCYFPVSGVLSLGWRLEDGSAVNTLGIGRDGAVHAGPDLDSSSASNEVTVQLAGSMLRIPALRWQQWVAQNPDCKSFLIRYGEFVLQCSQQALACQIKHDVESRFCHWLLDIYDWQDGKSLAITHQALSALLGVRRTTITLIALSLQDAGIISYRRRLIEVTDLYALQQASCECHKLRKSWEKSLASRSSTPMRAVG